MPPALKKNSFEYNFCTTLMQFYRSRYIYIQYVIEHWVKHGEFPEFVHKIYILSIWRFEYYAILDCFAFSIPLCSKSLPALIGEISRHFKGTCKFCNRIECNLNCIRGGPKRMQHLRSIISRKRGTEWRVCVHYCLYNSFPSKMTPRSLMLMKAF